MNNTCTAIIVAAGRGARFGGDVPKQFAKLGDKPVLFHSVAAFAANPRVGRIVVIVASEWAQFVRKQATLFGVDIDIVCGGETRQQSVFSALSALRDVDDDAIVLVHDGARPLVTADTINAVLDAAKQHDAATAAVAATDTIKRASNGFVEQTLRRGDLYMTQTPQGFRADLLRQAHKRALAEGFAADDDCHLVERLGITAAVVPSERANIKITHNSDLAYVEFLLEGGWLK